MRLNGGQGATLKYFDVVSCGAQTASLSGIAATRNYAMIAICISAENAENRCQSCCAAVSCELCPKPEATRVGGVDCRGCTECVTHRESCGTDLCSDCYSTWERACGHEGCNMEKTCAACRGLLAEFPIAIMPDGPSLFLSLCLVATSFSRRRNSH